MPCVYSGNTDTGALTNIYQGNHILVYLNTTVTIDIVTTENHNKLIWGFIFLKNIYIL